MAGPAQTDTRFAFGRNWQRFLASITDERQRIARESITEFMGVGDLNGLRFVDVGCGSGLFSAAACQLGAAEVVSFDYDAFSVACCAELRRRAGEPDHWRVFEGSILDDRLVDQLGAFDVVYAWGVLHHTGAMGRAIDNAMRLMNERAWLYMAIYNTRRGWRGSKYWQRKKRLYCRLPAIGKRAIEAMHVAYFAQSKLLRFKNPLRSIREYQSKRGMNWYTDLVDWLGGYPYEHATVEQIFRHVADRCPDCRLVNLSQTDGLGCNQFLFKRE